MEKVNKVGDKQEIVPSQSNQDITGKASKSLSKQFSRLSPRSGINSVTTPQAGERKLRSDCKWYYMFLRNAEMKRFIDLFTGCKEVVVKDVGSDGTSTTTNELKFKFKIFPYTTSDHKGRFENIDYNKEEYEKRKKAALAVTEAFQTGSADKLNALTDKDKIEGDGYLFVCAPKDELDVVLTNTLPRKYLVTDYLTGKPAVIPEHQMQEFIYFYLSMPYTVQLLSHSLEEYTKKKIKIRITAGVFAGKEGYIMRLNRNNKLVFAFGNMTVAIGSIKAFPFERVGEEEE